VDVLAIASDKNNLVLPLIGKSVQCINVLIKRCVYTDSYE
jgi:hypothetical protein